MPFAAILIAPTSPVHRGGGKDDAIRLKPKIASFLLREPAVLLSTSCAT